jgi:hypothetical protein
MCVISFFQKKMFPIDSPSMCQVPSIKVDDDLGVPHGMYHQQVLANNFKRCHVTVSNSKLQNAQVLKKVTENIKFI